MNYSNPHLAAQHHQVKGRNSAECIRDIDIPGGAALGNENVRRVEQHAVPRAIEAQAHAAKILQATATELLDRLAPVLMAEPESTGAGQSEGHARCELSNAIDRGTADMHQVTGLLSSILRRLAL